MTEEKWATCRDPRQILDYHTMKKDPRRLRLLAAACVRRAVPEGSPSLFEQVIGTAEAYAESKVDRAAFLAARKAVRKATREARRRNDLLDALRWLTDDAMEALTGAIETIRPKNPAGRAAECELIRCLFGTPDGPPAIDPAPITATVHALAEGISADRAFDRMPVLADALEEAGCTDSAVLLHCRRPGAHASGCWVIDRLLGK